MKNEVAIDLIDRLASDGRGVLSVQCLTEFVRISRRKLATIVSSEQLLRDTEALILQFTVLPVTLDAFKEGLAANAKYQISYWDSFIWAVAKLNGVEYILSEDGQHGREIEGVRYLNPFVPDFVLPAA